MPDPGFALPDLCSIRTAGGQEELAAAVRGGFSADGCPPGVDDRPHTGRPASTAPSACPPRRPCLPWRASRLMSPTGTPTRWFGPTARPGSPPGCAGHDRRPGLRRFDGGAVRRPAPGAGTLPRPLAARAGNRRYPHGEHGPGLIPRSVGGVAAGAVSWSRAWPDLPMRPVATELMPSLGRARCPVRERFWSGSSAPPGRQHANRRQSTSTLARPAVPRRVLARPQPLMASASEGASAARQTRRVRPPGSRPSPPPDSVTLRRLRPALSMTRRWPRTGSACKPEIRCRNAGSPRCSDAHPAAGREPESPMQDKQRRSQTRRAPWSRPSRRTRAFRRASLTRGCPPGSSGTTWPAGARAPKLSVVSWLKDSVRPPAQDCTRASIYADLGTMPRLVQRDGNAAGLGFGIVFAGLGGSA